MFGRVKKKPGLEPGFVRPTVDAVLVFFDVLGAAVGDAAGHENAKAKEDRDGYQNFRKIGHVPLHNFCIVTLTDRF